MTKVKYKRIYLKIAYFKNFPRDEKLSKTIKKLEDDDFSQVKKLTNSEYFRIKVDYEDRIIFTFLKYENENYILLLEYLPNHEYEKSQFLKGKKWIEEDFIFPEKIEETIFINDKKEFRYLEKYISFSESQENILNTNPPIILIGSAGSGKTSVLIEKLRDLQGQVLYISLSKYLVENAKHICNCSENIEFLTFQELFQIQNEITFENFKVFANKQKISEIEKYFEEFRGVITADFEKPYLSESEYQNLGEKQSLFTNRQEIYSKFEKYLTFLKTENLTDSNMEKLEISKNYDFIVIDEVQDFTNSQISAVLKNGQDFILSGDANQIIYSNFFSWSKLKTMLFKTEENSTISILKENYRNSQNITEIANKLLKIKQLRFGSIDKESNYLIETTSKIQGDIFFWKDLKMAQEINRKKKDDVTFAVLVFNEKAKKDAKKVFETPLIFTIQEAKGLEYKNIILFNFLTNETQKFSEIAKGILKSDLERELKYSRPKDKTDRELDTYKIYINSLYVALTRTIENLYIVEKRPHRLWELLNVIDAKVETLENSKSEISEWQTEKTRLEKFGRTEQIEGIGKREKIKLSVQEYLEKLKKDVFENGKNTKGNRAKLFKVAKAENDSETISEMAEQLDFKSAKEFLGEDSKTNLALALQNRDIAKLETSLKQGKSVRGLNIFELVESQTNLEFIKVLLENGANPNSRNEFGETVLIMNSEKGYTEIAKLLIENNANIDLQNKDSLTALMFASQNGHTEIVKKLINANANLDLQNKDSWTALMMASRNGHTEIVKKLISAKANIDLQNKDSLTALMFASQDGHTEIVKKLINANANLDLQGEEGATSLYIASQNGHIKIVEKLINAKANLDLQKQDGATALFIALQQEHIGTVEKLINAKANINLQHNSGKTALYIASQQGHTKIVEKLINEKANLDLQTKDSWTALMMASLGGNIEIVKKLISAKANLDLQNKNDWTALMLASSKGYTEIVEKLISAKANLDLQDKYGLTVLISVIIFNHFGIAKLLLENGANLSLKSTENKTALAYAKQNNHTEIIKLLEKTEQSLSK